MTVPFDADEVEDRWRALLAEKLLRAAVHVTTAEQAALSVGNPSPHKNPAPRGQHPRLRTGHGRARVAYRPVRPDEVKAALSITLGYEAGAFYLPVLGNRGWKWMLDTWRAQRPAVQALFAGERVRITERRV